MNTYRAEKTTQTNKTIEKSEVEVGDDYNGRIAAMWTSTKNGEVLGRDTSIREREDRKHQPATISRNTIKGRPYRGKRQKPIGPLSALSELGKHLVRNQG